MLVEGPIYTAMFEGVSVTAASGAGDLLQIVTPADAILIPRRAWLTTEDEETSQQVGISLGVWTTAGSGGTSVTPVKHNEHLQASQTTCLRNNTTDAATVLRRFVREGANLLGAGWQWSGEGSSIIVPVSSNFVMKLETALAVDTVLTGGVEFMELGQ